MSKKKDPIVLFKNYDLYDTEGLSGPAKGGPGTGLYGAHMDEYKSVSEFRRKTKSRRKKIKERKAELLRMMMVEAGEDSNNLSDPYENQGVEFISPYAPAEIAPLGLLDGIYPQSDFEGRPEGSNLYYGEMETHMADDNGNEELGMIENDLPAISKSQAYLLGQQIGAEDATKGQASDVLASVRSLLSPIPLSHYLDYCAGYLDGAELDRDAAAFETKQVEKYVRTHQDKDTNNAAYQDDEVSMPLEVSEHQQHSTEPFEIFDGGFNHPEAPIFHTPEVALYTERPSPEQVLEVHSPVDEAGLELHSEEPAEQAGEPEHLEITLEDLPGVDLDPEAEKALEVNDTVSSNDTLRAADEDAAKDKKSAKNPKWDWESRGAEGFVAWIKERLIDVPKHSGFDTSGLQRAVAYLEKLDDEISKAMRSDLDGKLDANAIEHVRSQIDDGVDRLHARIEKVRAKKGKGKRKKADVENGELIKSAQKATNIAGIVITVPLLLSRISRVIVNGMISGGHDLEDMYVRQCEYYKLDRRERAELQQLLSDMAVPLPAHYDRGAPENTDYDATSSDNFDLGANYQA